MIGYRTTSELTGVRLLLDIDPSVNSIAGIRLPSLTEEKPNNQRNQTKHGSILGFHSSDDVTCDMNAHTISKVGMLSKDGSWLAFQGRIGLRDNFHLWLEVQIYPKQHLKKG